MRAQRVVGVSGDPTAVVFALIAELVEIDGEKIVYEDLLAMDLNDVLALQSEVAGANFQGLRRRLRALVHFGFGVEELAAMDFSELSYWLEAVNEHNRSVTDAARGGD